MFRKKNIGGNVLNVAILDLFISNFCPSDVRFEFLCGGLRGRVEAGHNVLHSVSITKEDVQRDSEIKRGRKREGGNEIWNDENGGRIFSNY